MPFNWAGVALIGLAFVLFAAEFFVAGFGALGVGGAISLVLGGLLLTSGNEPGFEVSPWLIVRMAVVSPRSSSCSAGRSSAPAACPRTWARSRWWGIGRSPARTSTRSGFVFIEGERWKAIAEDPPVKRGDAVIITSVRGFVLDVRQASTARAVIRSECGSRTIRGGCHAALPAAHHRREHLARVDRLAAKSAHPVVHFPQLRRNLPRVMP